LASAEVLGAQGGDVATIRALWALQDRITLDAAEERTIEMKREVAAGQERTIWNPVLAIPPKEFEFSDAEVVRIRAAVETWNSYGVAADRRWLEPLLRSMAQFQQTC
jgi:hypothetical protein